MKLRTFLFLLFVVSLQVSLRGQDTLFLEVPALDRSKIKLRVNRQVPLKNEGGTLRLGASWMFMIVSKTDEPFNVMVSSGGQIRSISDFKKVHPVSNGKLDGALSLGDDLLVRVETPAENIITTYTAIFEKPMLRTENPVTGYKVGSAIYDAQFLRSAGDQLTKLKILAYYADVETIPDVVMDAYDSNKFLVDVARQVTNVSTAQSDKAFPGLSAAFSAVGGLDVTNVADGLARFLVKRTKEELNVAFFDRFNAHLRDDRYKDLRTVFPQTYRTFTIIGDEIYNYERYIQTLRENFRNDLNNLTTNLPTIVENHPAFFNAHPALEAMLMSSLYTAESLRDNVHPGDILNEFPTAYLNKLQPAWTGSIQTLQLFSASLRDSAQNESSYWVDLKTIKNAFRDTVVFRLYLGLTYQLAVSRYDNVVYNAGTSLVSILDSLGRNNLQAYQNYVVRLGAKTDKLAKMIRDYRRPGNDSLAVEQHYNYFKTSVDLLAYTTEISTLPLISQKLPNLRDSLQDYFDVMNTTADLVLDINRKNYSSAIANATHIYDIVRVKRSRTNKRVLTDQLADLKRAERAAGNAVERSSIRAQTDFTRASLEKAEASADSASGVMRKLFTYGSFMSGIVKAESPDDVQNAIEAFALPTGSARIKRETSFNVSLNAYLGPYLGMEKIRGLERNSQGTFGLTAPVGISISRGHSIFFVNTPAAGWDKGRYGWSTSLFFSLIDIGALASYRFEENEAVVDDSSSVIVPQVAAIKLKNIISPGAFLSIGIPKSPLSINAGVQLGPNLRSVKAAEGSTTTNNTYADNLYWRWSVSLVVDIPILNFYTKPKD
ncbi:MAG TPA: hypothetical protein VD816_10155 [Ohtaekwangia sp.]|nr:hypothetical protein [Ohtaekwangia sp.]